MMMSRRRLAFGLAMVLAMPASLQARGASRAH